MKQMIKAFMPTLAITRNQNEIKILEHLQNKSRSNRIHQADTERGGEAAKSAVTPLFGYVRDVFDFISISFLFIVSAFKYLLFYISFFRFYSSQGWQQYLIICLIHLWLSEKSLN